jgi:hypothetical protein
LHLCASNMNFSASQSKSPETDRRFLCTLSLQLDIYMTLLIHRQGIFDPKTWCLRLPVLSTRAENGASNACWRRALATILSGSPLLAVEVTRTDIASFLLSCFSYLQNRVSQQDTRFAVVSSYEYIGLAIVVIVVCP